MAAETNEGLRERKKQKTRATIVSVALELFSRNGYQQTTIAQIAEAADVSPRTVSTYFPAKEEIVFEVTGGSRQRLAEMIRSRDSGQDTMAALRAWVLAEREIWRENEYEHICQREVIKSDENLRLHERASLREFELVLADGLASDLELKPDDLEPRMAAAAAVAVFDLLSDERDPNGVKSVAVNDQLHVLDQALTFITGGVAAMRDSRQG